MPTTTNHDTPVEATSRVSGRGWAYTGALLGGAVSVAANIAHSYIPPDHAHADWAPETGSVIGSVFWPVALFVAVEILTRIPWPTGKGWSVLRFGGLLPVALVAAVVSYRHLSGLLDHYGEDPLTVLIGPLAVDGLMIMATGALLATGAHTLPQPHTDTTPTTTRAAASPAAEPTLTVPMTTGDTPDREPEQVTTHQPEPETPAAQEPETVSEPDPDPEPDSEPDIEQPVFAPWAMPPTAPARVNGHTPTGVTA